jgi:hypothetical protein
MRINECRKLKLSRKHFTLVAEILGQINDQENREDLTDSYADLFETTNRAFDRRRFIAKVQEVYDNCWECEASENFLAGSNL